MGRHWPARRRWCRRAPCAREGRNGARARHRRLARHRPRDRAQARTRRPRRGVRLPPRRRRGRRRRGRGDGARPPPLRADLGDAAAVAAALDRLPDEPVGIFVANAAATAFRPLLAVRPHHVEKTFAITIGAFLQIVQGVAPRMPAGGRIVTISGMDTHRYVAGHGVLAAAKAALEALTRYLAVELGPRGITVNCVNPGYVATDSVELYLGGAEAKRAFYDEVAAATPLRAVGEPHEVADLVGFLCSPEAAWMQG